MIPGTLPPQTVTCRYKEVRVFRDFVSQKILLIQTTHQPSFGTLASERYSLVEELSALPRIGESVTIDTTTFPIFRITHTPMYNVVYVDLGQGTMV